MFPQKMIPHVHRELLWFENGFETRKLSRIRFADKTNLLLFYCSVVKIKIFGFLLFSEKKEMMERLPYYCASICVRSWCNWRASSVDANPKKKEKKRKKERKVSRYKVVRRLPTESKGTPTMELGLADIRIRRYTDKTGTKPNTHPSKHALNYYSFF